MAIQSLACSRMKAHQYHFFCLIAMLTMIFLAGEIVRKIYHNGISLHYNRPHGKSKTTLLDARLIHFAWRIFRHYFFDPLHLVAASRGGALVYRLEWSVVAVHGLAAARRFYVHVHHHCGACKSQDRCVDRLRGNLRRAGNRVVGHANESLALLHCRTSTAVDHPCLADRIFVH